MWILLPIVVLLVLVPSASARVTPNDIFQQKRAEYEKNLSKITDPTKRDLVIQADKELNQINDRVCDRFQEDINKLAAIMDELRDRQGIEETRVAFGGVETPIENADYWVNWAAEAVAYQRIQDYTPIFSSESGLKNALNTSKNNLKGNLVTLKGKVLKAKSEVEKVLQTYEK